MRRSSRYNLRQPPRLIGCMGKFILLAFLSGLAIGLWAMFLLDYAIVSQCDELARNVIRVFPRTSM